MSCKKRSDYQQFVHDQVEKVKAENAVVGATQQPIPTITQLAKMWKIQQSKKLEEKKKKDKSADEDCKAKISKKGSGSGTPLKVSAVSAANALGLKPVARPQSTLNRANLILQKHEQRQKKLCSESNLKSRLYACNTNTIDASAYADALKGEAEGRQNLRKDVQDKRKKSLDEWREKEGGSCGDLSFRMHDSQPEHRLHFF